MTVHRIPRLGVTGGIGSGKSTATAYLAELGAEVVSADELVHHLLAEQAIINRVDCLCLLFLNQESRTKQHGSHRLTR